MTGSCGHEPVLVAEVLELMAIRPGLVVLDGTVGLAGHACALLERLAGQGRLIALDRDPAALAVARERTASWAGQVILRQADFGEVARIVAEEAPDGLDALLLDLGLSRAQLTSERFSFQADSRLDMRLDPTTGPTAADFLATATAAELERVLTEYGDEPFAKRIAAAIVEVRRRQRLETAGQLTDIVRRAYPARLRHGRTHVATRTLQALRIAVNGLYDSLDRALADGPGVLRPGGRMGVISFHGGEDRRVKVAFRERAREGGFRLVTRKPVFAGEAEVTANPGARSARLRVLEALGPQEA